MEARSVPCFSERHQVGGTIAGGHGMRHVHRRLGRLSNWNVSDHFVAYGIDGNSHFTVL
jgi:hypothetical protein